MEDKRNGNFERMRSCALQATIFLCIVLIILSCNTGSEKNRKLQFVLKLSPDVLSSRDYYLLEWKKIEKILGPIPLTHTEIMIRDLNNDEMLVPETVDTNEDNIPEFIKIPVHNDMDEPLRPYELIVNWKRKNRILLKHESITQPDEISIEFLKRPDHKTLDTYYKGHWADAVSETFVHAYDKPSHLDIYALDEWTYTTGFFLNGLCYYDMLTGKDKYLSYVKGWLDFFVNGDGSFDTLKYDKKKYRLDDVLPGRSLLYVYKKTGNEKYLKAAEELLNQIRHQPRTSEGGYWHKKIYEWQMWLDGIYMSDVFLLQYASLLNEPQYYDDAIFQYKLIYEHTLDSVTGLLFHGWDESRQAIWADPLTGRSPEFWGRGMGWYMMALVDALDYIPVSHPDRDDMLKMLVQLSSSVIKYQDPGSGMWYQVIDKADKKGNWPETSCTAMFAYAFLKSYKKGYLPVSYKNSAEKAYEGLKKEYIYFDDSGKLYLMQTVKVGTLNVEVSNGSYDYYVSVDRRVNDFKGIGALLYLAIVDEYMENLNPEGHGL
jgi:unsaturated rhamnogalacturonyl hydrolase